MLKSCKRAMQIISVSLISLSLTPTTVAGVKRSSASMCVSVCVCVGGSVAYW